MMRRGKTDESRSSSAASGSSSDSSSTASGVPPPDAVELTNTFKALRAAMGGATGDPALSTAAEAKEHKQRTRRLWAETCAADEKPFVPPLSDKEKRKVAKIKRLDRADLSSSLDKWKRQGHSSTWPETKARLLTEFDEADKFDPIPRVHARDLSVESFRAQFERPNIPCVVDGVADAWPAREKWGFGALLESDPDVKLKCGEDDEENSLKLRLKTFVRYQESEAREDDSPLYVFDATYDDRTTWMRDYDVPFVFPEDLFALVGEARRPPNRWFLLGPERSGTTVHIDPLGTSAWNTLIRGRKLWVCFPPDAPRWLVKARKFAKPGEDDEAVDWFSRLLPRALASPEYAAIASQPLARVFKFVQHPGETVFVPHDWWHAVLNVDDTVAVTQNYVGSVNFERAWRVTRVERRKMALRWREKLRAARPDLYAESLRIDARDGFDLERHIAEKRERRRAEKEAKKKAKVGSGAAGGVAAG